MLAVDRNTHRIGPQLYRGKDIPSLAFDEELTSDKPIDLKVLSIGDGKMYVVFGEDGFPIDCDFEVKAISVVGSGADVRFEPFSLLRKSAKP